MAYAFTTKSGVEWVVDRISATYVGVFATLDYERSTKGLSILAGKTNFDREKTPLYKYRLPATGRGDTLPETKARVVYDNFKRKGMHTLMTPGHTWTVTHDGIVFDSTTGKLIEFTEAGLC